MMGPRTESLVILLLVSRCSPALPDLGLVEESLSDLDLNSLGRDFSQIYTGWVNSSFIYPYYLKGSSIFNDVYGSVNRTGLVIAGAALVGVSGLAFLGELNAIPNVDGVADSVKGFQSFMQGVVSRFQVQLFNLTILSNKNVNVSPTELHQVQRQHPSELQAHWAGHCGQS